MKSKLTFVIGMGVGYVLGARAGRSSYEKIKSSAKTLWNKDQVQDTFSNLQENLKGQAGQAVHALVDQVLPGSQAGPDNPADGENSTTIDGATPPDTAPEVSDEFPDAALDGGEAEKWTSRVRSRRHQPPAGP